MRILVLGGDGMLGHQLLKTLGVSHDARVTLRNSLADYASYQLFDSANSFAEVSVTDMDRLTEVLANFRPAVVINAVGIVKQRPEANIPLVSLQANAVFPHRLAALAALMNARVIHFSTDCVFSGRKGNYAEDDVPDGEDLYGRTKLLGEVTGANGLTLRTGFIGRELDNKSGLVEWFLAQQGTVYGYRRAIYSGLTTAELSRVVEMLVTHYPQAQGLWHVSAEPISKFALLLLLKTHYRLDTEVIAEDGFVCDRSLDSSRFRSQFGYTPPSWEKMIAELAQQQRAVQE